MRVCILTSAMSLPKILAVPEVGNKRRIKILIVVVLPAPLPPKKPKICPPSTESVKSSNARTFFFFQKPTS